MIPFFGLGTKNVLCLTAQVHIVVAGSSGLAQRFARIVPSFLFRIQAGISTQSDHIVFYVFAFYTYIFTVITMDTDILISEVCLRPAISDRRLKVYTNRAIVDYCWREISGEMEVPGK